MFSSPLRWQLYVGNLTWWTTDQDIQDGVINLGVADFIEVKFYENRANGQSKGFCCVSLGRYFSTSTSTSLHPHFHLHLNPPSPPSHSTSTSLLHPHLHLHLYPFLSSEASMRKVMDLFPKKELHGQNPVVTYATKQVSRPPGVCRF